MVTKEDLSEQVNEKLGTDMEWERLKKDDLERFDELIDEGLLVEQLLKQLAKEKGAKKVNRMVDEWRPGKLAARFM